MKKSQVAYQVRVITSDISGKRLLEIKGLVLSKEFNEIKKKVGDLEKRPLYKWFTIRI